MESLAASPVALVALVALVAGAVGVHAGRWADIVVTAEVDPARGLRPPSWSLSDAVPLRSIRPASRPTPIELVTPLVCAAFAWWFASTSRGADGSTLAILAASLVFIAVGIPLIVVDVVCHRLPDSVVLPAYVLVGMPLAIAALVGGDLGAAGRAVTAMVLLFSVFLVVRVVSPRSMGGGDVKLAGVLGLLLGWCGWTVVVVGVAASFVLGGLYGLALIARGRAHRRTAIPFGPWMIAGAWVGIAFGQSIGQGIAPGV